MSSLRQMYNAMPLIYLDEASNHLQEQLLEDILLWNQEIYCIKYSFELFRYLV